MACKCLCLCVCFFLVLLGVSSNLVDSQVLFQGFNWESWKQNGGWYNLPMGKVDDIADAGITHVWLSPPSHSVAEQGGLSHAPSYYCHSIALSAL